MLELAWLSVAAFLGIVFPTDGIVPRLTTWGPFAMITAFVGGGICSAIDVEMAIGDVGELVGIGKGEFGMFMYVFACSGLVVDNLSRLGRGGEFCIHVEEVRVELCASVRVCPENRALIFVKRQVPVRPCMYLLAFACDTTLECELGTIGEFNGVIILRGDRVDIIDDGREVDVAVTEDIAP